MKKEILDALSTFAQYGKEPLNLLDKSGFSYKLSTLKHRLVKEEVIDLDRDCHGVIAGVEPYDAECFVSTKFGPLMIFLKRRFAYNKITQGDIYT